MKQACSKYESAWRLRESAHAALYNWGVALSDMAHCVKVSDRAAAGEFLSQAAEKYAGSLQWNPSNPQVIHSGKIQLNPLQSISFHRFANDNLSSSA